MNKKIIFGISVTLIALFSINSGFAQEPGPPKIPEPSPEPKPIKLPEPDPIREPFPEESDTEKIQRLTEENEQLQEENLRLKIQVNELNEIIEKLQAITLEQIKVIMQLVEQLKEIFYEGFDSLKIKI